MVTNKLYQFDSNMKVKGFCCEKCAPKCGVGVCLFQNPEYAENSAGIIQVSGFKIKIILMCRVNPLKIRQPKKFQECWILNPTADEIRPYRILIKKIPCSSLHENRIITTGDSPIEYITKALESNDISFLSKKNDTKYGEYTTINVKANGELIEQEFCLEENEMITNIIIFRKEYLQGFEITTNNKRNYRFGIDSGEKITLNEFSSNKNLIIGFNTLVILFIMLVFDAICIIPFHIHIVPKNVIVSFTASPHDSKTELFTSSILPVKKPYMIDIIIKIGHIIFSMFFPFIIIILPIFILYS